MVQEIAHIKAIDQHAHNILKEDGALPFEAAFTEASDPEVWKRDTPHGLFYRRSVRQLAELFQCEPDPAQVKAARSAFPLDKLASLCIERAHLKGLLLDDGLAPKQILPWEWHSQFVPTHRLLRVEHLAEEQLVSHSKFSDFEEAFRSALEHLPPEVVGLKSIAAYRGGLSLPESSRAEAKECFTHLSSTRMSRSPLYSYLIHSALEIASKKNIPIQFHTGFGDPDLALEQSNPLLLRPLIEKYACPFVVLHGGYPYVREAGFLSSVYLHVWVDFGLALPFLSVSGMRQCLRALLELTPLNKLLYSSDASLIPELYYLGSLNSRQVLSEVLEETVLDGDLSRKEALQAAHWILADNAEKLYFRDIVKL